MGKDVMPPNNVHGRGGELPENQEIDLVRLLGVLVDHYRCISVITIFFVVMALMYGLFSVPVYIADAVVQVEAKQQNVLLKTLNQLNPGSSSDSSTELQLLKSRMILGKTVEDMGLQNEISQMRFPVFGKGWARLQGQETATLLLAQLILPEGRNSAQEVILSVEDDGYYRVESKDLTARSRVGVRLEKAGYVIQVKEMVAAPGTRFVIRQISKLGAINELSKRFNVIEMGKESGILGLSLTGTDPERMKQTLDSIADNYLQQNIARQAAQDSRSLDFLKRQLPLVRSELEAAEESLNTYRKQHDSVDLSLEAKSVLEQIVNVDNQLNELTFREAEVSQHYKTEHPTYRALLEKRQTLEEEKHRLNKRVAAMPSTQQEILRLSRDVDSGRVIYQQLLTRQQELNISRSSAIGNVRIIDAAVVQPNPIKPKKTMIVLLAGLFGLMMSSGLVLVWATLRKGIDTPEQLESLGMSVYATLPHSEWLARETRLGRKLFCLRNKSHKTENIPFLPVDRPLDNFVEALRGLRTSLHFAMMDSENNILMFSGPTPDCGKTVVSTSLSAVVAQTGKKVLFIDADMRKGYAHNIFSLSNNIGLSDVLSGAVPLEDAVQRYIPGQFNVLTCGATPPNPSELLMHERFSELMQWVNERYDMVIIDAPPVLAVTDAVLVGRHVATTLLVARFNDTRIKEILISVRRLQQSGVNIKGVVINDLVRTTASYYSAGYRQYGHSGE